MSALRVLVADDNAVVRTGLTAMLEADGIEVVGQVGDGQSAIEAAERLRPDLVLLDVRMPLVNGMDAAAVISRHTRVLMLTYTDEPEVIRTALANGAAGYLVHDTFSADELLKAVRDAAHGGNPLSPAVASVLVGTLRQQPVETLAAPMSRFRADASRKHAESRSAHMPEVSQEVRLSKSTYGLSARECEVMDLISQGCSNSEIAERLYLAEKTVKNHINRIYAKLAVTSRGAAIARWLGTAQGSEDPVSGPQAGPQAPIDRRC